MSEPLAIPAEPRMSARDLAEIDLHRRRTAELTEELRLMGRAPAPRPARPVHTGPCAECGGAKEGTGRWCGPCLYIDDMNRRDRADYDG